MIIFTKGLPGSGKSYAVKQMRQENPNLYLVCKDDIRKMLFPGKYNFSRAKEDMVKALERDIVESLLRNKYDVAIHNTHLAGDHEWYYKELAYKYHTEFRVLDYTMVPLEDCLVHDHLREDRVGYKVILGMAKKYLPEQYERFKRTWPDENYFVSVLNGLKMTDRVDGLPDCIICDVDGTLALLGNRDPYNGELAYLDTPNKPIIELLQIFNDYNQTIIFVFSGRKEEFRKVTEEWLYNNDVPYHKLVMRADDDERPDDIIKLEMYQQHITGQYNCLYVIDDRNSVVRMWREKLNLCTLQCNYGAF